MRNSGLWAKSLNAFCWRVLSTLAAKAVIGEVKELTTFPRSSSTRRGIFGLDGRKASRFPSFSCLMSLRLRLAGFAASYTITETSCGLM